MRFSRRSRTYRKLWKWMLGSPPALRPRSHIYPSLRLLELEDRRVLSTITIDSAYAAGIVAQLEFGNVQLWADEIVVESSVDASANTRTGPRLELHASTITFRPGADIITQEGDLVLDGVVALDEGAATLFSTGLGAGGSVHLGTLTGQRSDLTIQTGSGDILLDGTIDNLGSLTLNSSGITRLSGAIGSSAPIASLTTDAGGLTDLRGGHIHASTVELADTIVLTTDVTINATTVRAVCVVRKVLSVQRMLVA